MTTRKTTKRAAQAAKQGDAPTYTVGNVTCDYRPWWVGKRRAKRATAFDTYAAAALTGLLVREGPETTLSELVEGALHLASLMELAKEDQGK
jgi:hypothetical protein